MCCVCKQSWKAACFVFRGWWAFFGVCVWYMVYCGAYLAATEKCVCVVYGILQGVFSSYWEVCVCVCVCVCGWYRLLWWASTAAATRTAWEVWTAWLQSTRLSISHCLPVCLSVLCYFTAHLPGLCVGVLYRHQKLMCYLLTPLSLWISWLSKLWKEYKCNQCWVV